MAEYEKQGGSGAAAATWSTGLFDCCAGDNGCCVCISTFFCFPCMFGFNAAKMSRHEVLCGESCSGACCLYTLACLGGLAGCGCCPWLYNATTRVHLRTKYNIAGNPFNDCLVAGCCAMCALCQERREMAMRSK